MVIHETFTHCGLPKAILSDRGSQFKASQLHEEAEYQYLLRQLGIELIYGKVEDQFRFIQRDFVLENLHHSVLDTLIVAWGQGMNWHNWQPRHHAHQGECPADHYVRSLRQPNSEDLELHLIHEEPRKVMRTRCISYYGHTYRVPDDYIGRRVWTVLKGENLRIEYGKEVIAQYPLKTDYLQVKTKDS